MLARYVCSCDLQDQGLGVSRPWTQSRWPKRWSAPRSSSHLACGWGINSGKSAKHPRSFQQSQSKPSWSPRTRAEVTDMPFTNCLHIVLWSMKIADGLCFKARRKRQLMMMAKRITAYLCIMPETASSLAPKSSTKALVWWVRMSDTYTTYPTWRILRRMMAHPTTKRPVWLVRWVLCMHYSTILLELIANYLCFWFCDYTQAA